MADRHIFTTVPLPPPVHGHAVVSAAVVDFLTFSGTPVRSSRLVPRLDKTSITRYAVARFARALAASGSLIAARMHGASVYYGSLSSGLAMYVDGWLSVIAHVLGMRTFLHHHGGSYFRSKRRFVERVVRLGKPTHIFLCEPMAAAFRALYGPVSYLVLDNAHTVVRRGTALRDPGAPVTFGHLGNLSYEKGLDVVLSVARRVLVERHDARFFLGGPISTSELGMIDELLEQFGERFRYWGGVWGEEKSRFYDAVDVFILPSRAEAQPLVLYEAAAAGCLLVTTDVGWIRSQVESLCAEVVPLTEFEETCLRYVEKVPQRVDRMRQSSAYGKLQDRARAQLESMRHCMVSVGDADLPAR